MSGPLARPPALSRVRRFARGFTLIELTVSLVAGLVVAMAVAVLSHEATASFNDEVRVSAAEATLRGAADRLRFDLQRASYMSTPNIELDPNIAKLFGQATALPAGASATLRSMQGIQLYAGTNALNTKNGLGLEATNSLTPASIDITGAMTTADQFEVQNMSFASGCCTITLAATSPAMFRVLNSNTAGVPDPNSDTEMQNIFAPAPATAGFTTAQFWVRYVDIPTNHEQYLLTCAGSGVQIAGTLSGGVVQPYVKTTTCPLTGAQTGGQTATNGNTAGLAWVNPVQTARWEVVGPSGTGTPLPAQDINALDNQATQSGADPAKYDLLRSYVDGNGNLLKETTEIVAEYVVHLDFAFSVDIGDTTGTLPNIVSYDFGDPANQSVAGTVNVATPVNGPATPDPQRIRSVRFMIATRGALPDRTAAIPVQTVSDGGGGTFLYRYCMTAGGCSGNSLTQWARVRTLISEVALVNQQQAFY